MQKIKVGILFLFFGVISQAQIIAPVKWTTSVEKVSDIEYVLVATATIDTGWHLYSQNVPEDGPIPTSFIFEGSSNFLKKGNTKEEKGHTIDDPIFEMQIKYFDTSAKFEQRIKVKISEPFTVNAIVEFMVCNDTQCLPPKEVDLMFQIQ
ncbi:MAG: cytochrome C biogenesis protein [Flavobacteriaceae bacterium]|nr:cytochrome C biogenesis protein [Flavobacteriaceae bacterium]